jgi:hypothetical protein
MLDNKAKKRNEPGISYSKNRELFFTTDTALIMQNFITAPNVLDSKKVEVN